MGSDIYRPNTNHPFKQKVDLGIMNDTAKHSPRRPVIISFRILLCIGVLLMISRWYSVINSDFVLFTPEIHAHISNLSLSMIFYLAIGYSWLLNGKRIRFIVLLGVLLVIANIICETLMGFMNTPDIVDALYGIVGVGVSFVFLLLTHKYGLISSGAEEK